MNMLEKYAELIAVVDQLKNAQINYKPEWQAYQFLLAGKMFAYIGTNNHGHEIITLKGEPANNQLMIGMYDCVTEGYYANKIHWISIRLDDPNSLSQDLLVDLLKQAYQLIFDKLPKKVKQEISV